MSYYLLMCRSLTYAQRTARILERFGITAIITRAPQSMSAEGCAYCVKISENKLSDSLRVLKNAGAPPVKIFLSQGQQLREVTV